MRHQRVEDIAREHVSRGRFSGIEWLIHRDGREWLRGRTGHLDALAGTAMPDRPIYRIYSMTKPVVAVAALQLLEKLRFRLYEPVSAFLPQFSEMRVLDANGETRPAQGPLILEHLFTHKAGFSYGFISNCPVGQRYRNLNVLPATVSLAEKVDEIAAEPLAFDPGCGWRYSVASDVLARVLEVVSGKPIGAVLKDMVFDPLGMTETAFMVAKSERHRIMAMFGTSDLNRLFDNRGSEQELRPADVSEHYPADNPNFGRGGHGLFSTLDDYMKFCEFLTTGRTPDGDTLLSRKTLEFALQNRVPAQYLPLAVGPLVLPGYGFSLLGRVMLDTGQALSLTSLGENGWAGAASTFFWIDPDENLIGIVMSQYLGSMIALGDDIRTGAYQALD